MPKAKCSCGVRYETDDLVMGMWCGSCYKKAPCLKGKVFPPHGGLFAYTCDRCSARRFSSTSGTGVCAECSGVDARWVGTTRKCPRCALRYRPRRRDDATCSDCQPTGLRAIRMRAAREKGTHTQVEWLARQAEYGGLCAYCKVSPGISKDHVLAVSCGGSDAIENIVPACRSCNSRKGARDDMLVLLDA